MAKKEEKNIKDKTSFMKSFRAELKKVIWPTPSQLVNNTIAVLAIVIITVAIVFVLDFAFESMNKYGIDKIKEVVSNSSNVENSVNETNETTDDSDVSEENSTNSEDNNTIDNENANSTNEQVTE